MVYVLVAAAEMEDVSSADAASILMKRFDFFGATGPKSPPDGEWHYQELAQYVNASKRPPGEPLNVTASNMMLMIERTNDLGNILMIMK